MGIMVYSLLWVMQDFLSTVSPRLRGARSFACCLACDSVRLLDADAITAPGIRGGGPSFTFIACRSPTSAAKGTPTSADLRILACYLGHEHEMV